jgi:predicted acylesterase/phospholipase RssA
MLFDPFEYESNYYIDGGVWDNFPIMYEVEHTPSTRRLGIYIDFHNQNDNRSPHEMNMIEYIYKIIKISLTKNIECALDSLNSSHVDILKLDVDRPGGIFNFKITTREQLGLFLLGHDQAKLFFS